MAKGDYYFPLYYKRLLTSTIGWSDAEFGCYVRLLIHQFDNGSIPNDVKKLSRISPGIKKYWPLIRQKFVENSAGDLVNQVMEEVRESATIKASRSKENGKRGGRPNGSQSMTKKTQPVISGLPKQNLDESYPITNNQEPIIERDPKYEEGPAPDLKNSNLFRQPKIPTKQQVWEVFAGLGGTREMAKSFYEKHDATGWFLNGSPIVNFASLASRFVNTWKELEKPDQSADIIPGGPKLKKI